MSRLGLRIQKDVRNILSPDLGYDTDAARFFTEAGITDNTIRAAVNTLVTELKSNDLWRKMLAIYPFVGGSASSHAWNLVDTTKYKLTFYGGWTHSSTGAQPNGTTGYADTGFNISTNIGMFMRNHHLAFDSLTQTPTGNGWNMGVGDTTTGNPLFGIALRRSSGTANDVHYDAGDIVSAGRISTTETDARGFYVATQLGSNYRKMFKNGTEILSNTAVPGGTAPNANIWIGAINATTGSVLYMNNESGLCSIGLGLTDAEVSAYTTIRGNFKTALGR